MFQTLLEQAHPLSSSGSVRARLENKQEWLSQVKGEKNESSKAKRDNFLGKLPTLWLRCSNPIPTRTNFNRPTRAPHPVDTTFNYNEQLREMSLRIRRLERIIRLLQIHQSPNIMQALHTWQMEKCGPSGNA